MTRSSRRTRSRLLAVAFTGFTIAGAARAAVSDTEPATGAEPAIGARLRSVAEEILDAVVTGTDGVELGRITELVIGSDDRVAYAVVDEGWSLLEESDLRAVPWSQLVPEEETFHLEVSREHFRLAPGFAENDWPDLADRHWAVDVEAYYANGDQGIAEKVLEARREQLKDHHPEEVQRVMVHRRLEDMIGMDVRGHHDETIAEIEDMIMDVTDGRLVLAQISFGGIAEIAEGDAMVPWAVVSMRPIAHEVRAPVDAERLQRLEMSGDLGEEERLGYYRDVFAAFDVPWESWK